MWVEKTAHYEVLGATVYSCDVEFVGGVALLTTHTLYIRVPSRILYNYNIGLLMFLILQREM